MGSGWIGRAALAILAAGLPARSRADPAPDTRYRAAVERPLFSPTRRPPPPAPALAPPDALPAASPSGPDLSLSGIIAGRGGGGVALLRRPQDAAPVHVALGGRIDGWTVAEIRPRSIVLRRDERSVTVDLPTAPR